MWQSFALPDESGAMARENSNERRSIEIPCPTCDQQWRHGQPADEPTCPDCGASFSLRVHDEFAVVEREGWAVTVETPR